MARLVEADGAAGMSWRPRLVLDQHRFAGAQVFGVFGAAEGEVEACHGIHQAVDQLVVVADQVGQLGQDAAFFLALGQLQLVPGVVGLDDGDWLDEECGSRGGLVVDDGAHLALELGAQWDDVAPVALGHQRVLQHGGDFGVADHALQAVHQAFVGDVHLVADAAQLVGGLVEDFTPLGDGARDGVDHARRGREGRGDLPQGGELDGGALEVARQAARGDERVLDRQQFGRVEHPSARGALHQRAHVGGPADGDVPVDAQQEARFGGQLLQSLHLFELIGWVQAARQLGRSAEGSVSRQALEHFGVFQGVQGLLVHNGQSVP